MKIILILFALVAGVLFFCVGTSTVERLRSWRRQRHIDHQKFH